LYHSNATLLLKLEAGSQINKTWRISAEAVNLIDRSDHDNDWNRAVRPTRS
jgi:hypothetical protein